MAPADPKKLFVPKLKENESEFDRSIFSYKEIACALQYLYVKLLYQKTRIARFLRALLNRFLHGPPFYLTKIRRMPGKLAPDVPHEVAPRGRDGQTPVSRAGAAPWPLTTLWGLCGALVPCLV